jgi:hypothetical protein
MPNRSTGLQHPSPSHSNEVERRLTTGEVETVHLRRSLTDHHDRISYLERAVQGLIWATSLLASGKSGDIVDLILSK